MLHSLQQSLEGDTSNPQMREIVILSDHFSFVWLRATQNIRRRQVWEDPREKK